MGLFRASTNSDDEIKMKTDNYYTCVAALLPQVKNPDFFFGSVYGPANDQDMALKMTCVIILTRVGAILASEHTRTRAEKVLTRPPRK